ncbi:putative ribonuclease H-like domain-containing protein [Tanacetum coccineum]
MWALCGYSSVVANFGNLEQSCSSYNRKCIKKECMTTYGLPSYVQDLAMLGFHKACTEQHLYKSHGVVGRSFASCGICFCKDDIEEIDLKWQLALLSMRTKRFFQKTGRKITINGSDTAGYDKSKVECFNCHKMGHFARECRGPRNQNSRNRNQDSSRRTINMEETSSKAMPEFEGYGPKTSKSVSEDISNEVRESLDALLVEELVSGDKLEKKTVFPTVAKIEFVRPKQQEKPVRKPVKYVEMYMSQSPRGNQRNWNNQKSQQLGSDFLMYNKAYFVCGSFNHVQAECNYHQRERVVSGNNYTRVNYNYSAKKAHPSAHRNMDSRAVLMKTSLRPLNNARTVNNAQPKTIVYSARPMSCFSKSAQSTGKFYTARPKAVNTTRLNSAVVNAVRANQGHLQKEDQGYVNSGCSRHMTGNMSYLSDFKEFDEGYVTFRGGAKGGKITSKGTLKRKATQSLLFTWVFFLASKDETSGILKSFITEIENLVDKKVKIIRCNNGIEFKNKVMSEFCEKKGIKREFSVARTPQQNGVAERRNRTLIEATRTMLTDSKLPTTFWAEAVNTACYVQNRVLVVKPHNKTPYELFRGRTLALSFTKPFGCHVTILNT